MQGNKILIPPGSTRGIIAAFHNTVLSGHSGVRKTLEEIQKHYTAPKLRQDVEQYIKKHVQCQ